MGKSRRGLEFVESKIFRAGPHSSLGLLLFVSGLDLSRLRSIFLKHNLESAHHAPEVGSVNIIHLWGSGLKIV